LDPVPIAPTLPGVIWYLGNAVNTLKAKHWKKNPQPVDYPRLRSNLSCMLNELVQLIKGQGLNPEEIYFAKHAINEKRIQNNY
jgi:hypothetical protein